MKSLERLSELTGIPCAHFKIALGQKLSFTCDAKTIEEARHAHGVAYPRSEAEAAAFERWQELSLIEIENAKTLEEIKSAYERAPDGGVVKDLALRKWIDLCTSVDEIYYLYDNLFGSAETDSAILWTWNELSLAEVKRAETFEEAKNAYEASPDDTEAHVAAIKKLIELCETVEEARFACDESPRHSESEFLALRKWNNFSLREIESAKTLEEIKRAYERAPENDEAFMVALNRWAEFCTSVEEALALYDIARSRGAAERLPIKRWLELCTTLDEAMKVYDAVSNGRFQEEILRKMHQLYFSTDA